MREIKFRAWNQQWQQMVEVADASWTKRQQIDQIRPAGSPDYCDARDFELMQYTGLKDKNGKEIYEGDIVERVDGSMVVIKWSRGSHSFEWFSMKIPDRFWNSEAEDWEISEVVGNIYENPSLLEVKK